MTLLSSFQWDAELTEAVRVLAHAGVRSGSVPTSNLSKRKLFQLNPASPRSSSRRQVVSHLPDWHQ